ncbi:stalk domain-containing protein [Paenibacillus oryzisoli]|uniref:stalk domain-containing protein n=1 Tax=Paenibacillus oryzisoli TaxID=1850517 RepID=UPI003D2B3DB2
MRVKKWVLGVSAGAVLVAASAAYASEVLPKGRQVAVNQQLLHTPVEVAKDGTTMTSARAVAEALGASVNWNEQTNTVEIQNADPTYRNDQAQGASFLSSLLHGRYSLQVEVIGHKEPGTTVVFSDGYVDVPENTDFQKLFLMLLVEQLRDQTGQKIEFWSNKELAKAYVAGRYKEDTLEGWSGLNARFGELTREGEQAYLTHILSVHERDAVILGKYKERPLR